VFLDNAVAEDVSYTNILRPTTVTATCVIFYINNQQLLHISRSDIPTYIQYHLE